MAEENTSLLAGSLNGVKESLFIGTWQVPYDIMGQKINKIFNVFAAPEDLSDNTGTKAMYSYANAAERVSELTNWNGFDGAPCVTDREFNESLRGDSYNGGWVIPSRGLLSGNETPGREINSSYRKVLKETFAFAASQTVECTDQYWTSTVPSGRIDRPNHLWSVSVSDDHIGWSHKDARLSCRPVRLVLVPGS